MTYAIGVLILGFLLIVWEYRAATAPDPKDKFKRRRKLGPAEYLRLRGLLFVTIAVAAGVWAAIAFID